jgi:flagellin
MSFRINTNIDAFDAQRNLQTNSLNFSKSIEKLSSGLRINRAGDDAAGLSISEKLRAQVKGTAQAVRNAQDGISMVQTTEGALNEVQSILQRMRELGVQGSSGTLSTDDRTAVNSELKQLRDEINRISSVTDFNGTKVLGGSTTSATSATLSASQVVVANGGTMSVAGNSGMSTVQNGTYTVSVSSIGTGGVITGVTIAFGSGSTATSATYAVSSTGQVNIGNGLQVSFSANSTATVGTTAFSFTTTGGAAAGQGVQNVSLQIGANTSSNERLNVAISSTQANVMGSGLATTALAGTNLYAATNLDDAVKQIDQMLSNSSTVSGDLQSAFRALVDASGQALKDTSAIRSTLGASQNRLEHTIANLGVAQENLSASESRIRDVDMASEMVNYTKTQILQQAGTAILSQANQAPNGVLSLLR